MPFLYAIFYGHNILVPTSENLDDLAGAAPPGDPKIHERSDFKQYQLPGSLLFQLESESDISKRTIMSKRMTEKLDRYSTDTTLSSDSRTGHHLHHATPHSRTAVNREVQTSSFKRR